MHVHELQAKPIRQFGEAHGRSVCGLSEVILLLDITNNRHVSGKKQDLKASCNIQIKHLESDPDLDLESSQIQIYM